MREENFIRAIEVAADEAVNATFAARANASLDDSVPTVDTGRHSGFVETYKVALQSIDLREGLLIQRVVTYVAANEPGVLVFSNASAHVTEPDRALVARNRYADLSRLAPPAAGEAVRSTEIDLVIVDPEKGLLRMVDIKRGLSGSQRSQLDEAALALRRQLQNQGLAFRETQIIVLRWFTRGREPLDRRVATRETVDERLGFPVRAAVETALRRYRIGIDRRLRALVARSQMAPQSRTNCVHAEQPATAPADKLEAFRRAFGRAPIATLPPSDP